jgi:hypothetical protein
LKKAFLHGVHTSTIRNNGKKIRKIEDYSFLRGQAGRGSSGMNMKRENRILNYKACQNRRDFDLLA